MRVAVIGTGIAGNAAAWSLSKHYPVTVYDRDIRPGGHSHTVTIDYDGTELAVDIGFIVYNELNYPDLTALFARRARRIVVACLCATLRRGARYRPQRRAGAVTVLPAAARLHLQSAVGVFLHPRRRRTCASDL
jgi:phytoene dehydrogenase-like protein